MGIKVGWEDRVLKEIGTKRDHFVLLCQARLVRTRVKELHQELDKVEQHLVELNNVML